MRTQLRVNPRTRTGLDGGPSDPGIAIPVPVSERFKAKVARAAHEAGLSMAEWVRRLIEEKLRCG